MVDLEEKLLRRPNYAERVCGKILNALFILIIGALALTLSTVILNDLSIIDGESMEPTLLNGQYVLCEKNPRIESISRGDIITFEKTEKVGGAEKRTLLIKRVVALGGDTVEFRADEDASGQPQTVTLYIQYGSEGDFVPLEEDYIKGRMHISYWTVLGGSLSAFIGVPVKIEQGCVFALGDNRDNSKDSRYAAVGQVRAEEIVGRVTHIVPVGSLEEAFLSLIYGTAFKQA